MLTKSAYQLLDSISGTELRVAVFLMANYDIDKFCAVNVQDICDNIQHDLNDFDWATTIIDKLVRCGFLEYGPFVRGWNGKRAATVRIQQRLLIGGYKKLVIAKTNREREELATLAD